MDAYHIHHLPEEVIRLIFSYLDVHDKLNVSCVSKQWLTLMNTPMLLLDISVTWTDRLKIIPSQLTRNFQNFIFLDIELAHKHHYFFRHHGKYIRSMTFSKCSISTKLENIFKGQNLCENLNILIFENCCLDIFRFLPELKLLQFLNVKYNKLDDIQWNKVAPNIKEIYVDPCCQKTMDVINSFGNILVSFSSYFLSAYEKNNNSIYIFLKSNNLRLKKFYMWNTFDLNSLLAHDTITDIVLGCLKGNTDQIVSQVCNGLRLLEKLSLWRGCSLNTCLVNIFKLENLKSLSFYKVRIKNEGLINALREPRLGSLRELNFDNVQDLMIDNETFKKFLIQIPNLRSLQLSRCSGFVNNITIQSISKYLIYLRNLTLHNLKNLTDEALFLPECPDECLQNIKGLRSLRITYCKNMTSRGLSKAIGFFELRNLTIGTKHENELSESELKLKNRSLRNIIYLF